MWQNVAFLGHTHVCISHTHLAFAFMIIYRTAPRRRLAHAEANAAGLPATLTSSPWSWSSLTLTGRGLPGPARSDEATR